jgi:hypothetical protein
MIQVKDFSTGVVICGSPVSMLGPDGGDGGKEVSYLPERCLFACPLSDHEDGYRPKVGV